MNGAPVGSSSVAYAGVDTVFVIRAGQSCRCTMRCGDGGVEHLLCRQGTGRRPPSVTPAPPVKVGTVSPFSGPGATNLITGLVDALFDSVLPLSPSLVRWSQR